MKELEIKRNFEEKTYNLFKEYVSSLPKYERQMLTLRLQNLCLTLKLSPHLDTFSEHDTLQDIYDTIKGYEKYMIVEGLLNRLYPELFKLALDEINPENDLFVIRIERSNNLENFVVEAMRLYMASRLACDPDLIKYYHGTGFKISYNK